MDSVGDARRVQVVVDAPFETASSEQIAKTVGDAEKTDDAETAVSIQRPAAETLEHCCDGLQRETDGIIKKRRSEQRQVYLDSEELVAGRGLDERSESNVRNAANISDKSLDPPATHAPHMLNETVVSHSAVSGGVVGGAVTGAPVTASTLLGDNVAVDHAAVAGETDDGSAYGGPIVTHFTYFYDLADGSFKMIKDESQLNACVVNSSTSFCSAASGGPLAAPSATGEGEAITTADRGVFSTAVPSEHVKNAGAASIPATTAPVFAAPSVPQSDSNYDVVDAGVALPAIDGSADVGDADGSTMMSILDDAVHSSSKEHRHFLHSAADGVAIIPESLNSFYHAKYSLQQVGGSLIDELLMQDPRTISALRCTAVSSTGNVSGSGGGAFVTTAVGGTTKRRKASAVAATASGMPTTTLTDDNNQSCHALTHLFRFPRRFHQSLVDTSQYYDDNNDQSSSLASVDVDVVDNDETNGVYISADDFYLASSSSSRFALPCEDAAAYCMLGNNTNIKFGNNALAESSQSVLNEEMYQMRKCSPFKRYGASTSLKQHGKVAKQNKVLCRRIALAEMCTQIFDDEQRRRISWCATSTAAAEASACSSRRREQHAIDCMRRYNSIIMTCNRWLTFMSQHVQWDEAYTLWLHAWILDFFLPDYFRIYLDILHRARQHCPMIIENLCNFLPPTMSALDRHASSRSPLLQQWLNTPPWDPVMPFLLQNKPPRLGIAHSDYNFERCDFNIKILLIPPAPDNEHQAQPPRRISNLMEHLSGFAQVERVAFPPAWFPPSTSSSSLHAANTMDAAECWRHCLELCMERADSLLNDDENVDENNNNDDISNNADAENNDIYYYDDDTTTNDEKVTNVTGDGEDGTTTNNNARRRRRRRRRRVTPQTPRASTGTATSSGKRQLLILWGWELGSITALMAAKRIYHTLLQNYARLLTEAAAASLKLSSAMPTLAAGTPTLPAPSVEQLRQLISQAFPRICVVCFGFPLKYIEMFAGQHALYDMLRFDVCKIDMPDSAPDSAENKLFLRNNVSQPSVIFLSGSESRKCNWRELEAHRLSRSMPASSSSSGIAMPATTVSNTAVGAAQALVSHGATEPLNVPAETISLANSASSAASNSWHFVLENCNDNLLMRMSALNEFSLTQTLVDRCIVDQVRECVAYLVRREPVKLTIRRRPTNSSAFFNNIDKNLALLPHDINTLGFNKLSDMKAEKTGGGGSRKRKQTRRDSQVSTDDGGGGGGSNSVNTTLNSSALDTTRSLLATPSTLSAPDALEEAKKAAKRLARQIRRREKKQRDQEMKLEQQDSAATAVDDAVALDDDHALEPMNVDDINTCGTISATLEESL